MTNRVSRVIDCASPVNWAHPQAKGLVSWWLCLPGIGGARMFDLCNIHAGNHGVLTGMGTGPGVSGWNGPTRQGAFGDIAFDGADRVDRLECGLATNVQQVTTSITVTAWVYMTGTGDRLRVFDMSNSGFSVGISVGLSSSGSQWSNCLGGTTQYDLGTAPSLKTWTPIALTYDGSNVQFYMNGTLQYAVAKTNSISYAGTSGIRIGCNYNTSWIWKGRIDDIRIYNRCLDETSRIAVVSDSLAGYPGLLRRVDVPPALTVPTSPASFTPNLSSMFLAM